MPAPLRDDAPTGNPKHLFTALLLLAIAGGTLFYAASLPAQHAKKDIPQVEGTATTAPAEEYVAPDETKPQAAPTADVSETAYQVVAVADGDTVKVTIDGKTESIRLIGVDTPETRDPRKKVQCYGKEASAYTSSTLLGRTVRLAADESQDNRDKYGRLLRYVFLGDGMNFNLQLIAEGYAYEYTYKIPYEYQAEFKEAQATAEANQKGLWSPATCSGHR
jgi:micrococcal nuclease